MQRIGIGQGAGVLGGLEAGLQRRMALVLRGPGRQQREFILRGTDIAGVEQQVDQREPGRIEAGVVGERILEGFARERSAFAWCAARPSR